MVDTDDTTYDGRWTTPWVWHKLLTGELTTRQTHLFSILEEAESRPDKIESTSNNA